jgi:hypothetical protein
MGGFDGPQPFELGIGQADVRGLWPFQEALLVSDTLPEHFCSLHSSA